MVKQKRKIRGILIFLLPFVLMLFFGLVAVAQSEEEKIEIIHADEMVYDGNAHTITYTGSVHLIRGTMDLRSNQVVIVLNAEESGIEKAYAEGNVVIVDGTRRATAGHAEFKETDQKVVLTRDPHLFEGQNELLADQIVYDMEARTMRAVGNVRGTFFPNRED